MEQQSEAIEASEIVRDKPKFALNFYQLVYILQKCFW